MAVFIKIILVIFSFIIGLNNIDYGNVICSITSFSVFLYFFINLKEQYKNCINDNWVYSDTNHYSIKRKIWDDSWFNNSSYDYDYGNYYNSSILNKSTIKILEKKIKKKKHNFIEFCEEPKFLKKYNKNMIVDNSDSNKPKLDLYNVIEKSETEKVNKKMDGNDVIMVINDNNIDNIKKNIYDVIIKTLNKYNLSPNERYALFQSFFYIDVCPMSIVIYIDNFIIGKAHLNESNLHKDELVDKIRDVLYCPNMDVTFVDLNCVNLLNYYLSK